MKAHSDLAFVDVDSGWHVDEIPEDHSSLRIGVTSHFASQQAIQAAGDNKERHVEIDLQADGGGKRIDVKEAHSIRERVLDQHALSVAGDELRRGAVTVVGEQDGRLVVSEI